MKYEVALGYVKTMVVEANSESEAITKAHSGDWVSEGDFDATGEDEIIDVIEE